MFFIILSDILCFLLNPERSKKSRTLEMSENFQFFLKSSGPTIYGLRALRLHTVTIWILQTSRDISTQSQPWPAEQADFIDQIWTHLTNQMLKFRILQKVTICRLMVPNNPNIYRYISITIHGSTKRLILILNFRKIDRNGYFRIFIFQKFPLEFL